MIAGTKLRVKFHLRMGYRDAPLIPFRRGTPADTGCTRPRPSQSSHLVPQPTDLPACTIARSGFAFGAERVAA
jgi:hypothetical protein